MKGGVARSISISFISLFVALTIATLFSPVSAQTTVARPPSPAVPAGGARTAEITDPPSIIERQYMMRQMEIEAGKPPLTAEQKRLALAQIADDYAQIQVINNKMMSAAMKAPVPNYESIAETIAEIGKRAGRIKTNLPLPGDDKKEADTKPAEYKNVVDPAGMKASLLFLDATIMRFVNNPIFNNTSVVPVREAAKAKRDLDTIVEFSNLIGKDAKKLSKTSNKRP
jgi:hypothetical protein